jgi:outer membrane protein
MKKLLLSLTAGLMVFGSVSASAESLMDIYQLALENDAQLKADEAAYRAGLEMRVINRAGLLPQVNASAEYTTGETDRTDYTDPDGTFTSDSSSTGWAISLNQPLFNMASWYNYRSGVTLSERAEAEFAAAQQDLILRVAEAYFNVLRATDNLETAQAEEKALKQQLEQTRQRYEVGLTAITEVHEAQSVYDSASAAVLQARGNLGIAYEALEVLTGRSHDHIAPLSEDFAVTSPVPADRHEWVEFALQNNYSLKAARLTREASHQNARAAGAQHLPTLTGSARYSSQRSEGTQYIGIPRFSDSRTEGHSFGVTLDVPLYSGGRTSAQRRQAHAEHLLSQEQLNVTQRNIIQATRALHLSVDIGVSQVHARRQATISSESALEATQAGYEVGTRNLVEVLLAQRAVYQARRDYDNALYDYIINSFELRQVAGMLTPADIEQVDASLQHNAQNQSRF